MVLNIPPTMLGASRKRKTKLRRDGGMRSDLLCFSEWPKKLRIIRIIRALKFHMLYFVISHTLVGKKIQKFNESKL